MTTANLYLVWVASERTGHLGDSARESQDMSEPMYATGRTRPHTCKACGRTDVHQKQLKGTFRGVERWMTDPHNAPCGLPCWGSSIGAKVYKSGQYHRSVDKCPRCGKQAA